MSGKLRRRNGMKDTFGQVPRQLPACLRVMLVVRLRFAQRCCRANDDCHVFGPGAPLPLLTAAAPLLKKRRAAPTVPHVLPLWSADLLRRYDQHVPAQAL